MAKDMSCHFKTKHVISGIQYIAGGLLTSKPCKAKINHSKNLKQATYMYLNSGPLKQS